MAWHKPVPFYASAVDYTALIMARGSCAIRKTAQCVAACMRSAARAMLRRSAPGALELAPAVLASQHSVAIALRLMFCIVYPIIPPVCLIYAPRLGPC